MQGISWLAENRLASEEWLCSMQLVNVCLCCWDISVCTVNLKSCVECQSCHVVPRVVPRVARLWFWTFQSRQTVFVIISQKPMAWHFKFQMFLISVWLNVNLHTCNCDAVVSNSTLSLYRLWQTWSTAERTWFCGDRNVVLQSLVQLIVKFGLLALCVVLM
jgi:hypothetical protein